MEMRKHSQIQETECMEFVGGEKRITSFLGHEQLRGRSKGQLKGTNLGGGGKINSHPSTMINAHMKYLGFNGESSLKNIKVSVTVM